MTTIKHLYVLSSLGPLECGRNDRVVLLVLIDEVLELLHIASILSYFQLTQIPLTRHRLLKHVGNVDPLGISNSDRLLSSLPPRILNTLFQ